MATQEQHSIWRSPLRLIILTDDTLEKVRSVRFRLIRVCIWGIVGIFTIATITAALIAFTPIKRLLPGYGDIRQNKTYISLLDRVESLETTTNQQELYIQKLQSLLSGEHSSYEDHISAEIRPKEQSDKVVSRITEDDSLREKVTIQSAQKYSLPPVDQIPGDTDEIRARILVPPLKGIVSSSFSQAKGHLGIDILAPANSAIQSVDAGVVIAADWTIETGYVLGIQHKDNLISYYKHNSSLLKSIGEQVDAGEAVAIIGNTGHRSNGPHLHFELWYDGRALNPADYIKFSSDYEK